MITWGSRTKIVIRIGKILLSYELLKCIERITCIYPLILPTKKIFAPFQPLKNWSDFLPLNFIPNGLMQ